jgi:hypothetical protein
MLWMQLLEGTSSLIDPPQGVPTIDWAMLTDQEMPYRFVQVNNGRIYRTRGWIYTQGSLDHSDLVGKAKVPFSMGHIDTSYALGRSLHNIRATYPKDYVYGLGGVTGIRIPVDYGTDVTVSQVYQTYVSYWLTGLARKRQFSDWDDAEHVCEELWFLDTAETGFLWKDIPDLPS